MLGLGLSHSAPSTQGKRPDAPLSVITPTTVIASATLIQGS